MMTRRFFLTLLASGALFLTGCGGGTSDLLPGTWRLTAVTGGFSGSGRAIADPETLTLQDRSGLWKAAGRADERFDFALTERLIGGQRLTVLDRGTDPDLIVRVLTAGRLELDEDVSDGFSYTFTR